jgi:hypothetical protein
MGVLETQSDGNIALKDLLLQCVKTYNTVDKYSLLAEMKNLPAQHFLFRTLPSVPNLSRNPVVLTVMMAMFCIRFFDVSVARTHSLS